MENLEIRKLIISMKEKEKDLQSISPKMISIREKLKKEISEFQHKINNLRRIEGTPLNKNG